MQNDEFLNVLLDSAIRDITLVVEECKKDNTKLTQDIINRIDKINELSVEI